MNDLIETASLIGEAMGLRDAGGILRSATLPEIMQFTILLLQHRLDEIKTLREKNSDATVAAKAAADAAWLVERTRESDDEVVRLNYYSQSDFAAYNVARAAKGTVEWVDFNDYTTPCPTPEQWKTLTPEQKAASGSVRFK